MSSLPANSLTRNGSQPLDADAAQFVAVAAWLRHGMRPDAQEVDRLTPGWREHFDELARALAAAGPSAVEVGLEALPKIDPKLAPVVAQIRRAPRPRKTHYTPGELLTLEIQPPRVIVPGLLHEGLNLLGGRPKLGKSWLALQIALAVSTGGKVFGQDVERGPVLYLALEDNEARLKTRMIAQGWTQAAQVDFHLTWPLLAEGGLDELWRVMEERQYRLVVIDTASRFMGGKLDQMDPGATNDAFGAVQQAALASHAAALMLDHHRKTSDYQPDPVDDLLGSTGKAAPADAVLGLYRQRGQSEATLMITGRDLVESGDLALTWDTTLSCWQAVGKAGEVARDTLQAKILLALSRGDADTTTDLAIFLSKSKPNVSEELSELLAKGYIVKLAKEGKRQPYALSKKGEDYLAGGEKSKSSDR